MSRKTVLFAILASLSITSTAAPRKVIGLSQTSLDDAWRQAMVREMRIELSNYDDLDLIVYDAGNNPERQVEQIRELIRRKVDVLAISPIESQALTEATSEAWRSGIPTIVTDRKVFSDDFSVFIGADNEQIGRSAGQYALTWLSSLGCRPKILEIWGLAASSPARERHDGFTTALSEAGIKPHLTTVYGNWKAEIAADALKAIPPSEEFDLIFCHNDMMAISAYEHFVTLGGQDEDNVHIIGVDAVAGAGVEAVADGRIDISFLYPTGGAEVVRTARAILAGETIPKQIELPTSAVDRETARTLLLQTARMEEYRQSIEKQRSRLDGLTGEYHTLLMLFVAVAALCILLVIAFFIILSVQRKLARLNREIRQAADQKLQFFVNLSLEVRKPLTLILAPLENLRRYVKGTPMEEEVETMFRGSRRMLDEVNLMLDIPERPLPPTDAVPLPQLRTDLTEQLLSARYPYRILLVEPDDELREWTSGQLSRHFELHSVVTAADAIRYLEKEDADVIVSDVVMEHMNGIELCDKIKGDIRFSHIPVILLTTLGSDDYRLYATSAGADLYITKPFSIDYLNVSIIRLMASRLALRRSLLEKAERTDNPAQAVESLDEKFLRKFISLIGRVYADQEYNIERLSTELGMSRGHLYRKVSDLTGMSPVEYLGQFRLRKALELLENTPMTVNQIAYETGFSSPAYFTKRFRELYGRTPTEIRR